MFYIPFFAVIEATSKNTEYPDTLLLVVGHDPYSESDFRLIMNSWFLSVPSHILFGFNFYPRNGVLTQYIITKCIACMYTIATPFMFIISPL